MRMYAINQEYLNRGLHLIQEPAKTLEITSPPGTEIYYYNGKWIIYSETCSYPAESKGKWYVYLPEGLLLPIESVFLDRAVKEKFGPNPNRDIL